MVGQGSGGFTLSRAASLSLFCARARRYFVLYISIVYAGFASILSNGLASTLDFGPSDYFDLGLAGISSVGLSEYSKPVDFGLASILIF